MPSEPTPSPNTDTIDLERTEALLLSFRALWIDARHRVIANEVRMAMRERHHFYAQWLTLLLAIATAIGAALQLVLKPEGAELTWIITATAVLTAGLKAFEAFYGGTEAIARHGRAINKLKDLMDRIDMSGGHLGGYVDGRRPSLDFKEERGQVAQMRQEYQAINDDVSAPSYPERRSEAERAFERETVTYRILAHVQAPAGAPPAEEESLPDEVPDIVAARRMPA